MTTPAPMATLTPCGELDTAGCPGTQQTLNRHEHHGAGGGGNPAARDSRGMRDYQKQRAVEEKGTKLEGKHSITTEGLLGYNDRVENWCLTCQRQLLGCYQLGCGSARTLALAFAYVAAELGFAQTRRKHSRWTGQQEDDARKAAGDKATRKLQTLPPPGYSNSLLNYLNDQYLPMEVASTSGRTFTKQVREIHIDETRTTSDGDETLVHEIQDPNPDPETVIIEAGETGRIRDTEIPQFEAEFKALVDLMIEAVEHAPSTFKTSPTLVLLLFLTDFRKAIPSKDHTRYGPPPASDTRIASYANTSKNTIGRIRAHILTPHLTHLTAHPSLNDRQKIVLDGFIAYINQEAAPAITLTKNEQEHLKANQEEGQS